MSDRAVYCRRLTGAELLVNLKKSLLGILCRILLKDSLVDSFINAEHILDLLIAS